MGTVFRVNERGVAGSVRSLDLDVGFDDFEARWPTSATREETLPVLSWTQLERQLVDLAATPAQAASPPNALSELGGEERPPAGADWSWCA